MGTFNAVSFHGFCGEFQTGIWIWKIVGNLPRWDITPTSILGHAEPKRTDSSLNFRDAQ